MGEDEEWHVTPNGLGANRPGTDESQPAPKMLVGDPDHEPPQRTMAEEQEDRRVHRQEQNRWDQLWMERARNRNWEGVQSPIEAYRYSGFKTEITKDPRREESYIRQVMESLGVAEGQPPLEGLTDDDMKAVREVVRRKASALWIEGTPRTTLLHLMHDTRPTGPPVRTPPHNLKAEDSNFVAEQLMKEVETGQLERGNSPWASPPFPTKDFAAHKRQRKRRIVVDYRRVNQRTERAVYFVRNQEEIVTSCAGSVYLTLVDACKGFNQIVNTERARQMLAILARSGQYLPRCLTFGPTNGPEDFAFATDRVFAPGEGRRRFFCDNWQI